MLHDLSDLIRILIISSFTVIITCIIFYEIMYLAWSKIDSIKLSHRPKIFFIILTIFAAHTVCVWFYAVIYYAMYNLGLGQILYVATNQPINSFAEYIFLSAATYSSLGYDDVFPSNEIKFLTSVEVLNGLVLIAWSASYTYIFMEKFWDMRKQKKK